MRTSRFFGIHANPSPTLRWVLAALPYIFLVITYLLASDIRLTENPQDKLLPSVGQMIDAMKLAAFEPNRHTGEYMLWNDTLASLQRLGLGVIIAALTGLWLCLNMGVYPGLRGLSFSALTFGAMIPPLAILPILFITFGIDELAKVILIVFGIMPVIARDTLMAVEKVSREQIAKSLTLGASQLALTYRIILPQIMPRLIESMRLSLGSSAGRDLQVKVFGRFIVTYWADHASQERRLVALAEVNDGQQHATCWSTDGGASDQLAVITFLVSNDRTLECMFVPIKFLYPTRNNRLRRFTLIFSYLYGALGVWGLLQYPDVPGWVAPASGLYVVYYLAMSLFPKLGAPKTA